MRKSLHGLGAAICAMALTAASPPPPTLEEALLANRHSLTLIDGHLGGDGGAIVTGAVAQARIVALGEDHITREVPAFAQALCDLMAPDLTAMVVEAGPTAVAAVTPLLGRADRVAQMARFNAQYPNAIAFLDTQADNDAAAHCTRVARGGHFRLIGVDQEFLGAAGLIIDRILATRLSPSARRAMLALRDEERADAAKARQSGNPGQLLLPSIGETRIAEIEAALARGGTPRARALFAGIADSYRIYAKNNSGARDSNLVRSLLMKRQFARQAPTSGKMLMKFGEFHLYKAVSPRGIRDLGNHVAELSEGRGETSLHIALLGARGVHATFGGYGRPLGREAFVMTDDSDYPWLKQATEKLLPQGWTLFDLRPLRLRRIRDVSPEWARMIDGYDMLLMAPEFTPSDLIAAAH